MDASLEGQRHDLPDSAAALVDLAARWMRDAGLTGPLAGGSIEFTFDEHGRVDRYFAKTRARRGAARGEPASLLADVPRSAPERVERIGGTP